MVAQVTLARTSPVVSGRLLDRDALASVRFHPAKVDTGVVFTRRDLPGSPSVTCCVQHVKTMQRWSALERGGVEVHHTEHLLAALAGCGVDNVEVELDADRIPVVTGGSCTGFTQAIAQVGLKTQAAPRRVYRLRQPIEFEAPLDLPAGLDAGALGAKRYVLGVPAEGFAASYVFNVPAMAGLRTGFAEFAEGYDDFAAGAGASRTYYLRSEASHLEGILSQAKHEYIVLDRESSQDLVNEVARHKLIDFWGDLRLLGKPLWGRFATFRTGHRFHHDLIRELAGGDYLETVELS